MCSWRGDLFVVQGYHLKVSTLFQNKQDGRSRLHKDYQALNKIIMKNRYPILIIVNLFN